MTHNQALDQLKIIKQIPRHDRGIFLPTVELMTTVLMSLSYWPSLDNNENVINWFPRKNSCGVDLFCVERDREFRWEASWNKDVDKAECSRYGGTPQEAIYNLSIFMLRLFDLRVFLPLNDVEEMCEILNFPTDGAYDWGAICTEFIENELLLLDFPEDEEVFVSVKTWKFYGKKADTVYCNEKDNFKKVNIISVKPPKIIKL